ncbi:MAG: hypothetical protein M1358_11835 [Chloroflexi bacterium]|nr:hypothetical protein [Chloroflexota bacterium]
MRSAWIQQGVFYGAIVGAFWIVFNLMNYLAPQNGPISGIARYYVPIFFLVIAPVLYGMAGFVSSKRRKAIRAGAYAGFLTAVISMVISVGSVFVIAGQFMDTIRQNPLIIQDFQSSHFKTIDEFVIQGSIGSFFSLVPLSLIEGGVLGTLFGFFGARRPRFHETVG